MTDHPEMPPRVHMLLYPDNTSTADIVVDSVVVATVARDEAALAVRIATATMERMDHVVRHRESLIPEGVPIATLPN